LTSCDIYQNPLTYEKFLNSDSVEQKNQFLKAKYTYELILMFSNHVYKIIILPTLVIRIPNLEIFLFCQHNTTGGGNLELRQTIS
jgi:hypothetical protein